METSDMENQSSFGYSRAALQRANKHSMHNYEEIKKSTVCGCFCCRETFPASRVTKFIEMEDAEQSDIDPRTAICPDCETNSIIGDASGENIWNNEFLCAMFDHYFDNDSPVRSGQMFYDRQRVSDTSRHWPGQISIRHPDHKLKV